MAEVIEFGPGGYRYIRAVFQYSGGVAAMPGYAIERVRLHDQVNLLDGFKVVERHLTSLGRPLTALCACELRSPAPFTEAGFTAFNRDYVGTLERWGIFKNDDNPVARTNVCPVHNTPSVPVLHAFSYTVPASAHPGSFIIAGGGEANEVAGNFRDHTVRYRDTSPDGMQEKAKFVVAEMESRLNALGFAWHDAVSTQAYTVFESGYQAVEGASKRGEIGGRLVWHFARPPIVDIDFEMDVRGAAREFSI
jgi:hypothetical protein